MNMIRNTVARKSAWLSTIALVAAMHLGESALAQATSRPPDRMTYQGFIAGSDGVALGNTAPKNYDVIFRIYDGEGSNTPIWGEQQTVTVDKGYFSVLLGEGAATPGTPNAGISLSSLFNSASASDRYVGFTVKGVGSGGTDVEILPRVRLMSSPYAFLSNKALAADTAALADNATSAARATGALKLVQESNGAELLGGAGDQLSVKGNLLVDAGKYIMLGAGSGKDGSAGMISYQFHSPDSLEILGAGTTAANRKITLYAEGGSTFIGNASFLNNVGVNGNLGVSGILAQGNTQLHPAIDGGIVFGVNRTKEFPWNGSIHYGFGSGPGGQDTLVIEGGGNLVASRSVTTYAEGGFYLYGPLAMPVGQPIQLGFNSPGKEGSAGTIGYQTFSTGLDIVGAGTSIDRHVVLHGSTTISTMNASARYPLEILGYKERFGTGISIRAEWNVLAKQFVLESDRRNKDILGISSAEKDLENLRKIRVTDYRFKSIPNHTQPVVKGVIAQEVVDMLPNAVSMGPNIIPCDRVLAAVSNWKSGDRSLSLKLEADHGLAAGQAIRVEADGLPMTLTVESVSDARTIEVSGMIATSEPKLVALVGREVKDFLSVDYQQINMTAVSALQEVDRRLQAVDQRVQEVEKRELRVAELEKKAAARVEGLEREMAELRKLVAGIQSAKGKTESASVTPATPSVAVANAR
jgi:hypothetical protein